jgi:alpha,alpha-trehalose phosphorylase
MAAEVGHLGLAFDYLGEATLMDLEDLEHNTRDGLHIASLAGAWTALVAGFGGMRHHDDALSFTPRLPRQISRLAFTITVRQRRLRVEVSQSAASYVLAEGEPLEIPPLRGTPHRPRRGAREPPCRGRPRQRDTRAAAGPGACPVPAYLPPVGAP